MFDFNLFYPEPTYTNMEGPLDFFPLRHNGYFVLQDRCSELWYGFGKERWMKATYGMLGWYGRNIFQVLGYFSIFLGLWMDGMHQNHHQDAIELFYGTKPNKVYGCLFFWMMLLRGIFFYRALLVSHRVGWVEDDAGLRVSLVTPTKNSGILAHQWW